MRSWTRPKHLQKPHRTVGPDDRSTTQKSYFMPLTKEAGLDRETAHVFLNDSGSIETFLSPLVSHNLFDSFERRRVAGNFTALLSGRAMRFIPEMRAAPGHATKA